MKEQKGITLIILVITVILMLILISLSVPYSRKTIDDMKLNQFSSELKVIQEKLGVIENEIKMGSSAYEYIGAKIDSSSVNNSLLSSEDFDKATGILTDYGISSDEFKNFVLLTSDDLNAIGISKISQSVLVDYETQQVVSFTGITVNGTVYYWY